MPVHVERRVLSFSAKNVFSIIADIKRYPEFVPWCSAAVIHERRVQKKEITVIAELQAAYGFVRKSFTSRARIRKAEGRIKMSLLKGPLRHLEGQWLVVKRKNGCEVMCQVDFQFEGRLSGFVGERFLGTIIPRLVDSFEARAEAFYGSS